MALPIQDLTTFQKDEKNSRYLGTISSEKITSNIACDGYQALIAMGTVSGAVEVFNLQGSKKTLIPKATSSEISVIQFVPNRPFLIALDRGNTLSFINYQNKQVHAVGEPADLDQLEEFNTLYIPDYLTGNQNNEDFVFVGTSMANLFIFSITLQQFLFKVKNPLADPNLKINDLKLNILKPHRVLVSYKNQQNETSAVVIYSLNKNRVLQKLEFQPSRFQELGQALAVDFSPDCQSFVVTFSSGKIQVFKTNTKHQSGIIRPFYQVELDNVTQLTNASLRWREISEDRHCLYIFYETQGRKAIEREVALFIGKSKQPLSKSFFINSLSSNRAQLQNCAFGEFIINSYPRQLAELLGEEPQADKKKKPSKVRDAKVSISNLIVALGEDSKLYYYNTDMIGQEGEANQFKLFTSHFQTELPFFDQKHVNIDQTKDKRFIQYIEELGQISMNSDLMKASACDPRFKSVMLQEKKGKISKSVQSLLQYTTNTELEAFLMSSKGYVEGSTIVLGYIFGISNGSTLTVSRIEPNKTTIIIQCQICGNMVDSKVTAFEVSMRHQMIIFALQNGQTLQLSQTIMSKRANKIQTLEFKEVSNFDGDQSVSVSAMSLLRHGTQKKLLLVQGYSNGKIKIYNMTDMKVIYSIKNPSNGSSISCIYKQVVNNLDKSSILFGSSSGCLSHVIISKNTVSAVKTRQIDQSKILQIKHKPHFDDDVQDNFFVLTEFSLLALDRLTFTVKRRYNLDQFAMSLGEKFTNLFFVQTGGSNYALACYIAIRKHLMLFNMQSLVSDLTYDMGASGVANDALFSNESTGTMIAPSQTQQLMMFTLEESLPFLGAQETEYGEVYDLEQAITVNPKQGKKGLFSLLFQKNITIQAALNKHSKVEKKRSFSQGNMSISMVGLSQSQISMTEPNNNALLAISSEPQPQLSQLQLNQETEQQIPMRKSFILRTTKPLLVPQLKDHNSPGEGCLPTMASPNLSNENNQIIEDFFNPDKKLDQEYASADRRQSRVFDKLEGPKKNSGQKRRLSQWA